MPRRISVEQGRAALEAWRAAPDEVSRAVVLTAVRFTLEDFAERFPGRAVEVRVPPAGAVQILEGATHRRGTPPAVVEMDMPTWLSIVTGACSWDEAVARGRVQASGERADLVKCFVEAKYP